MDPDPEGPWLTGTLTASEDAREEGELGGEEELEPLQDPSDRLPSGANLQVGGQGLPESKAEREPVPSRHRPLTDLKNHILYNEICGFQVRFEL